MASAPPRRRQGGAASDEHRAGGVTGRCDGDARLRPPGAARGRDRRLVESQRGADPRREMRTAVELRSGSSRGLHSGPAVRARYPHLRLGSRREGVSISGLRVSGSPATRTYLSSRPRTVSGAFGFRPRIAVTQRILQTIGAPAARTALLRAGFSLPS